MVIQADGLQKDRRPMGAQRMTRRTLSPGIHARKGGDCGRRSPEKFALLFWPGEGRYRVRILPFTGREKIVAACYRSNLAAPLIVEDAPQLLNAMAAPAEPDGFRVVKMFNGPLCVCDLRGGETEQVLFGLLSPEFGLTCSGRCFLWG